MSDTPVYLMSPPRRDWTLRGKANFRSRHATPVNADRAREEWSALADAIVAAGGEVLVVPPHPGENLTGMIYTAEAGEFFRDPEGHGCFVLPRMASEHRRAEAGWIGGFMEGLGLVTRAVHATWEAQGDALRADGGRKIIHTFGTGRYKRTESRAYEEVAHLLGEEHIQLSFHADPWFHGNTFLNVYSGPPLPQRLAEASPRVPQTVLLCPEALLPGELDRLQEFLPEARFVFISREESESYDTNSLQVNDTVIASTTLSKTAEDAFEKLGLEVVKLEFSELFLKGGGAPVCLTNRMWGLGLDEVPAHCIWSIRPSIEAHTSV